jgi:hypothetical protein
MEPTSAGQRQGPTLDGALFCLPRPWGSPHSICLSPGWVLLGPVMVVVLVNPFTARPYSSRMVGSPFWAPQALSRHQVLLD